MRVQWRYAFEVRVILACLAPDLDRTWTIPSQEKMRLAEPAAVLKFGLLKPFILWFTAYSVIRLFLPFFSFHINIHLACFEQFQNLFSVKFSTLFRYTNRHTNPLSSILYPRDPESGPESVS